MKLFLSIVLTSTALLAQEHEYNVLFIISDDLTATALSCYGNRSARRPTSTAGRARHSFTRAYCQGTYCGPSRASFMSGYYPHATGAWATRVRAADRRPRHVAAALQERGLLHRARQQDLPHGRARRNREGRPTAPTTALLDERFNCQGPEWKAPGDGETLEGNPDGKKPVVGGNTFVVVEADGDDLVHSDGKTAAKACELIAKHKDEPFFLASASCARTCPSSRREATTSPSAYDKMRLPEKSPGDWDDIPKAGINYKTSKNMKMDVRRQKKAVGGYYASVAYMDAQVGKVLDALDAPAWTRTRSSSSPATTATTWASTTSGPRSASTTSRPEGPADRLRARARSRRCAPRSWSCSTSIPRRSKLCGLESPAAPAGPRRLAHARRATATEVRDAAFSVNGKGFLLRDAPTGPTSSTARDASSRAAELFDMRADPGQYTNLAGETR